MIPSNELISDLYFSEYGKLLIYAKAVLQDTNLAEDAVQETFYTALLHKDTLAGHPNPRGWLMQTLKYTICNINRAHARYLLHFISLDPEKLYDKNAFWFPPYSLEKSIDEETILRITEKLLTPQDYHLLKRIVFDKADYTTVSKELNITVSAGYKRLERIRKKLKKEFQKYL